MIHCSNVTCLLRLFTKWKASFCLWEARHSWGLGHAAGKTQALDAEAKFPAMLSPLWGTPGEPWQGTQFLPETGRCWRKEKERRGWTLDEQKHSDDERKPIQSGRRKAERCERTCSFKQSREDSRLRTVTATEVRSTLHVRAALGKVCLLQGSAGLQGSVAACRGLLLPLMHSLPRQALLALQNHKHLWRKALSYTKTFQKIYFQNSTARHWSTRCI